MDPLSPDDLPGGDGGDALDILRDPPRKRRPDIAAAVGKLAAALRRQAAAATGDHVPDSMITDGPILVAMDLATQAEQLAHAEQQGWGDPTGQQCRPPQGFAAALHALAAASRHAAVDVDNSSVLDVFSASIRLDHLAESLSADPEPICAALMTIAAVAETVGLRMEITAQGNGSQDLRGEK